MIFDLAALHARCVEEGECLLWQRACNTHGVPIVSLDAKRRAQGVRRLAFALYHGFCPEGMFISVSCNHPKCLSKDHLQALTRKQYMRKAAARGVFSTPAMRALRMKSRRAVSKLNVHLVAEIRLRCANGETQRAVADDFGVDDSTVGAIVRGLTWRTTVPGSSAFNP